LDELTTRELSDFLKAYAKHGKVAANRLLAITRQALGYAVESGYIKVNPADGLTRRVAGGEERPGPACSPTRRSGPCGAYPPLMVPSSGGYC